MVDAIGGLTKIKYELLGEAVSAAEKYQEAAVPGRVLVCDVTRQLAESCQENETSGVKFEESLFVYKDRKSFLVSY